ncbi:MAG: 5-formyltetrahydrofolate cyclo-ligase [Eubacterium sp.]|jgi:dihydrofolate synthase/folylpolyglutamate synthase
MTYEEALNYITGRTWSKTRLGLTRTRELLKRLGDPQKTLKFVHVAGSNGKGSMCAMTASVLRAAGFKTGLYISPHIQTFRERMQIDGELIPKDEFAHLTEKVRAQAEAMSDHPSQFELSTAVAMMYFSAHKCDFVVLEVGMGGKMDSTNAIDAPEVAVIMNIGLEHTEYLGSTLAEIASAKAGIIKAGSSVVCYDLPSEARRVIYAKSKEEGIEPVFADFSEIRPISNSLMGQSFIFRNNTYHIPLLGRHQLRNACMAVLAVEALRRRGFDIPQTALERGLENAEWPARFQVLSYSPVFILDGGHNPQCAEAFADSLPDYIGGRKAVFLLGILKDKDYEKVLDILSPLAAEFACVSPNSDRALPAGELASAIEKRGTKATPFGSVRSAITYVLARTDEISKAAETEDEGVVGAAFGSLYMAGDVLDNFAAAKKDFIRKRGIAARDAIPAEKREELSEKIAEKIASLKEFKRSKTVMIYSAVRGEADISALRRLAPDKTYCYPLCGKDHSMEAYAPQNDDAWKKGAYGIPEPDPSRSEHIPVEDIDFIVCPLTAFDKYNCRVGMGGGYYDRFLERCDALTCGAAFDEQEAEDMPREEHDHGLFFIATPTRIEYTRIL